jgi:uncharacterized protein (TIGR02246 family)
MKRFFVLLAILMVAVSGCAKKTDVDAERAAIRTTDAAWASAAAAKNADEAASFLAADATMMPPHESVIVGKDAIAQWMAQTLSNPGFSISWQATAVDVAASGDFAYSTGTNQVQVSMPDGSTITDTGKGLTIWKKQADGTWKVAVDIFNSDTPMTSPAAPADTTGQ